MADGFDVDVKRNVTIKLDAPGDLGRLITQLQAVAAKPAIGTTAVVSTITTRDGGSTFDMTLVKPEP